MRKEFCVRSHVSSNQECLPRWWFASYLLVLLIFAGVLVLLTQRISPQSAVWSVVTLSSASIGVVSWLRTANVRPAAIAAGRIHR